jgi:hypothetical protein
VTALPPLGNPSFLSVVQGPLLDADQCDALVAAAAGEWQPAGVSTPGEPYGELDPGIRSARAAAIDLHLFHEVFGDFVTDANQRLYRYDLTGVDPSDPPIAIRYDASSNDHFRAHRDYGPRHRTRKLTLVAQLSDPSDYLGGDLVLPSENVRLTRDRGHVVLFPAFLHHLVTPVIEGVRHSLVAWVHGPTFR